MYCVPMRKKKNHTACHRGAFNDVTEQRGKQSQQKSGCRAQRQQSTGGTSPEIS